jgi:hypothetical protein
MINTLWPEIVSRIEDPEPQIVSTVLDIVATLCLYAGDFMRTRVQQLWPLLVEIHDKTSGPPPSSGGAGKHASLIVTTPSPQNELLRLPASSQVPYETRSLSTAYVDNTSRTISESRVKAIVSVAQHAALDPDLFDEALMMLGAALADPEISRALDQRDADAVWLAKVQLGILPVKMPHCADRVRKWRLAEAPSHPVAVS